MTTRAKGLTKASLKGKVCTAVEGHEKADDAEPNPSSVGYGYIPTVGWHDFCADHLDHIEKTVDGGETVRWDK